MRAWPDLGYVHARMQARHGQRLDEQGWARVRASREVGEVLAAAAPWAPALARLSERSDPHRVDRALRAAWRDHVSEVASWTPPAWSEAVEWTAHVVDLPLLELLLGPEAPPAFARDDPSWEALASEDLERREAAMRHAGLDSIVDAVRDGDTARSGWRRGFESRWPRDGRAKELDGLVDAVAAHLERMDREADGWAERRALSERLARTFRWCAFRPVAIWAHLGLTALDLERIRAALVRLIAFPERSEAPWG